MIQYAKARTDLTPVPVSPEDPLPVIVSGLDGTLTVEGNVIIDDTDLAKEATLAALSAKIGTTADAAWDGVAATATVIALLKKIALNTVPA
jgi:hypothetical protein